MARTSKVQLVIDGSNQGAVKAVKGTEQALTGLQGKIAGLNTGSGLGGVLTGAAVAAGGKVAVDAASNLYEQQTKVVQVFGDSVGAVEEFGRSADRSIGQSERQALQAAGTFGNLFTAVGLGEAQAADMSITLTKLASDLASFNNVPVDDALTALRSGLVGEQEPLRRFGVNLNEATLKQKAMEMGLHRGKGVLSANAKAQAAYALILEQTGKAQGDFQRTSEGLANQQRISTAEWENQKAALGEGLLPVVTDITKAVNSALDVFGRFPQPIRTGTVVVGGLAAATLVLLPRLVATKAALASMIPTAGGAAAATGTLAAAEVTEAQAAAAAAAAQEALVASWVKGTPAAASQAAATQGVAAANTEVAATSKAASGGLGIVGKAGLAAAAGVGAYAATTAGLNSLVDVDTDTEALAEALRHVGVVGKDTSDITDALGTDMDGLAAAFNNAFDSAGYADRGRGLLSQLVPEAEGILGDSSVKIKENEQLIKDLDKSLAEMVANGNAEGARKVVGLLTAEMVKQKIPTERIVQYLTEYGEAVDRAAKADENAAEEKKGANDEREREASLLAQADTLVEHLTKREMGVLDAQNAVVDAETARQEALADLNTARQEAIGNSEEYRDAQEAIAEAEEGVADAQEAVVDAQRDVLSAQQDLNQARQDAVVRLREMAEAERQAKLDAADAALRVKEAQQEQERVNADPRSSALEKERAALEVRKAQEEANQAASDAQQAAIDNANAQRAGIEGDAQVVAARERVADANRKVRDAEESVGDARKRVADATKAAATIIEDAKAREVEAGRKAVEATMAAAESWGDLGTATGGALQGAEDYRRTLRELAAELDPNLPLMDRLAALRRALALITGTGQKEAGNQSPAGQPASAQPGGGQTGTIGAYPSLRANEDPDARGGGNTGNVIHITNINQGTPTQQRRASEHSTKTTLDRIVRGAG